MMLSAECPVLDRLMKRGALRPGAQATVNQMQLVCHPARPMPGDEPADQWSQVRAGARPSQGEVRAVRALLHR